MTKRPWQAQQEFNKRAGAVKAPFDIRVSPRPDGITVEWKRRPGIVDGFVIYVGTSPRNVREIKRIPRGSKQVYSENLIGFNERNHDCYITVMAYKGEKISSMPSPQLVRLGSSISDSPVEEVDTNTEADSAQPESPESVSDPAPQGSKRQVAAICGDCAGDVVLDEDRQVFQCLDCRAQYVQQVRGKKFVALSGLINGICSCCSPRRPLVKPEGEQHKRCLLTGERYAELQGRLIKLSELDYGLCTCCQPPKALMLNQQGQVVCSEKRDHLYVEENGRYVYKPPETPAGTFDEINEALSDGSAVMLPNGVLVDNDNNDG